MSATVTYSQKKALGPALSILAFQDNEIAGTIDELGAGVSAWEKGQRVGVGWHGGQDNTCPSCR